MNTLFTILLVIVLAFSALVIWKWNTWFGNPPETAYVTPATPDRVILTMGEDGTHTRRISWRCDTTLTEGWVELTQENTSDTLKLPAQGALVSSRSGHSAFYRTELSELQSGATYHYRVVNAPHASAWYTFSIPQPDSALSFIYIGDIQDQVEGSTQDLFRSIRKSLFGHWEATSSNARQMLIGAIGIPPWTALPGKNRSLPPRETTNI